MTELTLTEYPNLEALNVWKHPLINDEQRFNLKKYCDIAKQNGGKVDVKYHLKYDFGRYFLFNPTITSSIAMWSSVRANLFNSTEYDIDIANCHNCILLHLLEDKYDCDSIKFYCKNREKVIDDIFIQETAITKYNQSNKDNKTKKDLVKTLFTILLYGGTIQTWAEKFKLNDKDYKLTQFVDNYIGDIKTALVILLADKKYNVIKKQVTKRQQDKEIAKIKCINEKADKRKNPIVFDADKWNCNQFKILSVILQDVERLIILRTFEFCKEKNITITSYNYDGFQVLKNTFSPELIDDLNKYIQIEYPTIEFIIKPFRTPLDMSLIPPSLPVFNLNEFNLIPNSYEYRKEYFGSFVIQTQKPLLYIFIDKNKNVIARYKPTQLGYAFPNLFINKSMPLIAENNFIHNYIQDSNRNPYISLVYKPPPLKSNPYDWNEWNGWEIQTKTYKYKDPSSIYSHLYLMSGKHRTDEVYQYILNWIAWIIQFPAIKTRVALIFYSKKQGAGKDRLGEMIFPRILGNNKCKKEVNVEKIFGKFADNFGIHLINVNEPSGKATKPIHETIKDAVTRDTFLLELKGVDAVKCDDYANFVATTNNLSSFDIPRDDRRFMAVEVSADKANDRKYFDKLLADINDDDIIGTFYDEMIKRDLSKFDPCNDRVETKLMEEMKQLSISPYEEFYEYIMEEFGDEIDEKGFFQRTAKDMYSLFKKFWDEVGRTSVKPTLTKFGIEFKALDGVEKFKYCQIIYKVHRIYMEK